MAAKAEMKDKYEELLIEQPSTSAAEVAPPAPAPAPAPAPVPVAAPVAAATVAPDGWMEIEETMWGPEKQVRYVEAFDVRCAHTTPHHQPHQPRANPAPTLR